MPLERVVACEVVEPDAPAAAAAPHLPVPVFVRDAHDAESDERLDVPRDLAGLRAWLLAHPKFEGIVWHHPDGRRAKLKYRDFA